MNFPNILFYSVNPILLLRNAFGRLTLLSLILILCISGARTGNFLLISIGITFIIAIVVLVALNRWDARLHYLTIYIIGLSLVYLSTLPSNYLIGSDNHIELYFARLTQTSGWNPSLPFNMNNALSITIFAPFISAAWGIDLVWVFKAIYPLFYAFVPVILYFVFTHYMDKRESFLSAFFFIIVPSFFIEVAAIARQQIAEVFFVGFLALLVLGPETLRMRKWVWFGCLTGCGAFTIVSHYATGGILMFYGVIIAGVTALFRAIRVKLAAPTLLLVLAIAVIFLFGIAYYGSVSSGTALHDFLGVIPVKNLQSHFPMLHAEGAPPPVPIALSSAPGAPTQPSPVEPLMQTALGLDFLAVPAWAKVFRVFQYITQLLLLTGLGYFLWNFRKLKYDGEYLVAVLVSGFLLALCVLRPGFSSILNASRFYHFALMLMAPMIVLGGKVVFGICTRGSLLRMSHGILVVCVMVPYFLFTSGLVFEATRQTNIERFLMPYSYALSGHRLDLWGNFNKDDEKVRDFIVFYIVGYKDVLPAPVIYTDVYSRPFLQERVGYTVPIYFIPQNIDELLPGVYVFLRSYNNRSQTIGYWAGTGMREFKTYQELGAPERLADRPVMFQSGEAILYGIKKQ